MTHEQIENLKKLAEFATPGPWIAGDDEDSDYYLVGPHDGDNIVYQPVVSLHALNNAEYIAAASPDVVLALIAENEAQAARIKEIEITNQKLASQELVDAYQAVTEDRDNLRAQLSALQGDGELRAERDALVKDAVSLWMLLDDIDTADDMAKANESWYRDRVRHLHAKRFDILSSEFIDSAMKGPTP